MRPKHRNRRILNVSVGALVIVSGVAILASALGNYRQYYYTPSQVGAVDFVPRSEIFRVGGLVVPDSITRGAGSEVVFELIDFEGGDPTTLDVVYEGVLPDLFKEDSGAVVIGELSGTRFVASELLAKHDENYRPEIG